MASDGGTPPRTDTTVARVNVNRNLNKPRFEPAQYQAKILETLTIGEVVTTVTAKDRDRRVGLSSVPSVSFPFSDLSKRFVFKEQNF